MPRSGLSESVTGQQVCSQNRLAETSAGFAGNLECYQENRSPEPVSSTGTKVTSVHQNHRSES